jgi:Rod binding domain-containing protein
MLSISTTAAAAASVGQAAAAPSPRLIKAAHEFEGQMMEELLKPMTASNGLDGEDDDQSAGSGGALTQFASEALGRALSEQGGLGIAASIVRKLSPQGNPPVTSQLHGNLHGNTVIKFHE